MRYSPNNINNSVFAKGRNAKHAQGVVSKCSSRIAKSGSHAHTFYIGKEHYTVFIEDDLSPVTEGDHVRFVYETRKLKARYHNKYNAVIPESLIIDTPTELKTQVTGQVYILSNPSMPGLLKVGFTTGTALKRASELSSVTSVPTGFKVEWVLPILGDPHAVEKSAHAHLAKYRHGKEFFKVSLDVARAACVQSFSKLYPELAQTMDNAFSTRAEAEIKRREELAKRAEQQRQEREEENARQAFARTREGIWTLKGSCRVVLKDFCSQPNKAYPSLLAKLFGTKFDDYLEIKISPYQPDSHVLWGISISGRKNERSIGEYCSYDTQSKCIESISQFVQKYDIPNYSAIIEVPNALIENPPELPNEYRNPEVALTIVDLTGLVIRPMQRLSIKKRYR